MRESLKPFPIQIPYSPFLWIRDPRTPTYHCVLHINTSRMSSHQFTCQTYIFFCISMHLLSFNMDIVEIKAIGWCMTLNQAQYKHHP